MRSEEQMLNLIVETARADARIRAAFLQGSRTNPNAPRDIFQDYDVIYVVDETRPFREDRRWIDASESGFTCSTPRKTRTSRRTWKTAMAG